MNDKEKRAPSMIGDPMFIDVMAVLQHFVREKLHGEKVDVHRLDMDWQSLVRALEERVRLELPEKTDGQ